MKDAARFCDACAGSGRIKDLSIKCPVCSGSGFLNSNGQGIDPDEVARAMTTHHESARNGTFGSTDSNSQLNDHLVRDAEIRRAAAPHRAGWRITDQSRAHHARRGHWVMWSTGYKMSATGVRRDKAAFSSGCKPHPATAPAGSNRSSYGGDEIAEAFG
jgi:hypothetical protein